MESLFKLSEQGFGVHTFEIKISHLTKDEYYTIKERIRGISQKDKDDKCLIALTHSNSGIRIKLYKNKPFPSYLTVIVNPSKVLGDNAPQHILTSFDQSRLRHSLDDELKCYLGDEFGLNRFQLTRIDCTVDFIMAAPELSSFYIRLVSKSIRLNASSDTFGFYENQDSPCSSYNAKDIHCYRMTQRDYYSFTVYDKLYDLVRKRYIEDQGLQYGLLRFEIALMHKRINEVVRVLNTDDIIELVTYFTGSSENILKQTVRSKIVSGNYCKLSVIHNIFQKIKRSKAANRLMNLYTLSDNFLTFNELMKEAAERYSNSKLRDMEELRKLMDISHAVIHDSCPHDILPGIHTLFGINSRGDVYDA